MVWDSQEGILGREGEKCTASCLRGWTKQRLKDKRGVCRMGVIQLTVFVWPEPNREAETDLGGLTWLYQSAFFLLVTSLHFDPNI